MKLHGEIREFLGDSELSSDSSVKEKARGAQEKQDFALRVLL